MLVKTMTIQDYFNLLEIIKNIDYDLYMAIKMNIELGLATNEASKAEITDIDVHQVNKKQFYLVKIDKGTKNIIVNQKTGATEPRDRYVVCSTTFSQELQAYINDVRHKDKKRILQSKVAKFDGIDVFAIDQWYRKYYIENSTNRIVLISRLKRKLKQHHLSKADFKLKYRPLVPFKPHMTMNGVLGGRHLHKYMIESVCVPLGLYSERQIELHLGHKISKTRYGSVNYGAIANYDLIFRMIEATFAHVPLINKQAGQQSLMPYVVGNGLSSSGNSMLLATKTLKA